jgi:hypothetical protein
MTLMMKAKDFYYTVNTLGVAMVGLHDDYEDRLSFEICELMIILKNMNPPEGMEFRVETYRREDYKRVEDEDGNAEFVLYEVLMKVIEISADKEDVSEKQFQAFVNRIENWDEEDMAEKIELAYIALKEILDNQDVIPEDLSLDPLMALWVHGYKDFSDFPLSPDRGVVPSVCPMGCETEPDGKCQHGFESVYLAMGII